MKIMRVYGVPQEQKNLYPWRNNDTVLLLGEIENMPNHYVIATSDGRIHYGYHNDFFVDVEEDLE